MNKSIKISFGGRNVHTGNFLANRLLPNELVHKVGPFVFLEHVYPTFQQRQEPIACSGGNAHPHRGIVTLTYLLNGSLQHFDSAGHQGIVKEGGLHWMQAGKGVVHEEGPAPEFQREGGILQVVQFWSTLPSLNKKDDPEYRALAPSDIPEIQLPDSAGVFRVLLGRSGELVSPLKTFTNEFNFHLRLNPKSTFSYSTKPGIEYAVFVPTEEILVNGEITGKSNLQVLANNQTTIQLYNPGIGHAHAFLFGGEPYTESIVAEGPFVMNSREEITQAYGDFFEGRYGTIATERDNTKIGKIN